jgi:hypothetical protein
MPAIAVLGTFDTKGPEHGFVADLIRSGSSQPEGLAEGSRGSRRAQRDDTPGLLPIAHRPRRGRRRIPTGFRPLAQGWRTAPTLGEPTQQRNNLEEVAAGAGHNPFRVDRIRNRSPRVARASQPWATRRNPVGILCKPECDPTGVAAGQRCSARLASLQDASSFRAPSGGVAPLNPRLPAVSPPG